MAEPSRRDYSQVEWPWDDDPNWGPPREGATSDAHDDENWRLACKECGLYFPREIVVQTVVDHCVELHGRAPETTAPLELDLVWIGLGTPPETGT